VAKAEAALRSGQFEASIQFSEANGASSTIVFDLGDQTHEARLHITTTYQTKDRTQTLERIMIGERAWQRQGDGPWTAGAESEGVWGQLQAYLPRAATVANVEPDRGGDPGLLHWFDASRSADLQLQVDPGTGVPRQLRQVTRSTGAIFSVTYKLWNVPVDIAPPPGR
jgi:hypothetical protein